MVVHSIRGLVVAEEEFRAADMIREIEDWCKDTDKLIAMDRGHLNSEKMLIIVMMKRAKEKIGWLVEQVNGPTRRKRDLASWWSETWASLTGLATRAEVQREADMERLMRDRIGHIMLDQEAAQHR